MALLDFVERTRLNIPMNVAFVVHKRYYFYKLFEFRPGFFAIESLLNANVVEKIPTSGVLHDEANALLVLDYLEQRDGVGMFNLGHRASFLHCFAQAFIIHFINYFEGNLGPT